jgi:hypothetical protein
MVCTRTGTSYAEGELGYIENRYCNGCTSTSYAEGELGYIMLWFTSTSITEGQLGYIENRYCYGYTSTVQRIPRVSWVT